MSSRPDSNHVPAGEVGGRQCFDCRSMSSHAVVGIDLSRLHAAHLLNTLSDPVFRLPPAPADGEGAAAGGAASGELATPALAERLDAAPSAMDDRAAHEHGLGLRLSGVDALSAVAALRLRAAGRYSAAARYEPGPERRSCLGYAALFLAIAATIVTQLEAQAPQFVAVLRGFTAGCEHPDPAALKPDSRGESDE